jgi:hypothetical protein
MTSASLRAARRARVLQRITRVLERLAAPPLPPELPTHEQLREAREHRRYVAASPHFLASGGRIDVIRIPR